MATAAFRIQMTGFSRKARVRDVEAVLRSNGISTFSDVFKQQGRNRAWVSFGVGP